MNKLMIDESAFDHAESVYLDSPYLNGPTCYDSEYFRKAIEAYINHRNKPTEPYVIGSKPCQHYNMTLSGVCNDCGYSTKTTENK